MRAAILRSGPCVSAVTTRPAPSWLSLCPRADRAVLLSRTFSAALATSAAAAWACTRPPSLPARPRAAVLLVCRSCLFAVLSRRVLTRRWCPCIVSKNVAPEADQNEILCCLGSLTLYSGGSFPVFLLTGCQLRQGFVEKQGIKDDGAFMHLICGGVCHPLNLCQM